MRYALVKFKGLPTESMPVGMNDISGIGEYKTLKTAKRYLWESRFWPRRSTDQINEMDLLQVLAEHGWSHFGLYECHRDFGQDDKLVLTFTNPYFYEKKEEEKKA